MKMERKMMCRICGKPATGIHYGVWACEGCKAFYKRGVEKKVNYTCFFGNKCSTQFNAKIRCKACRFRKCAFLGMKVVGLELPEELKAVQKKVLYENADKDEKLWICPARGQEVDISSVILSTHNSGSSVANNTSSSISSSPSRDSTEISDDSSAASSCCTPDGSENSSRAENDLQVVSVEPIGSRDDQFVPTDLSDITDFLPNSRRLSFNLSYQPDFSPFAGQYIGNLSENKRQMISTVYAVSSAVEVAFGDQISNWTVTRDRALNNGPIPDQPLPSLEEVVIAINAHNLEMIDRILRFKSMLPGTHDLEPAAQRCTISSWKWIVYWTSHHAPFLTNSETYFTIGLKQQFPYSRFWQDMITEPQLLAFVYKFCTAFRDIGLTQIERYLLSAVVSFEPGDDLAGEQCLRLKVLHRHYTDVLMDVIRQRCPDPNDLQVIFRKMDNFFSILKVANQIHQRCFYSPVEQHPLWTFQASQRLKELIDCS